MRYTVLVVSVAVGFAPHITTYGGTSYDMTFSRDYVKQQFKEQCGGVPGCSACTNVTFESTEQTAPTTQLRHIPVWTDVAGLWEGELSFAPIGNVSFPGNYSAYRGLIWREPRTRTYMQKNLFFYQVRAGERGQWCAGCEDGYRALGGSSSFGTTYFRCDEGQVVGGVLKVFPVVHSDQVDDYGSLGPSSNSHVCDDANQYTTVISRNAMTCGVTTDAYSHMQTILLQNCGGSECTMHRTWLDSLGSHSLYKERRVATTLENSDALVVDLMKWAGFSDEHATTSTLKAMFGYVDGGSWFALDDDASGCAPSACIYDSPDSSSVVKDSVPVGNVNVVESQGGWASLPKEPLNVTVQPNGMMTIAPLSYGDGYLLNNTVYDSLSTVEKLFYTALDGTDYHVLDVEFDSGIENSNSMFLVTPPAPQNLDVVFATRSLDADTNRRRQLRVFHDPHDDRSAVSAVTSAPWRSIVRIVYDPVINTQTGVCSIGFCTGWMVNEDIVATAAHCLYDKGAWLGVRGIVFAEDVPTFDFCEPDLEKMRSAGLRKQTVRRRRTARDIGFMKVDKNGDGTDYCDASHGALSWGYSACPSSSKLLHTAGYPSDLADRLYYTNKHRYAPCAFGLTYYRADTHGGQSGSPVWVKNSGSRTALATHSGSAWITNYGARHDASSFSSLCNFIDRYTECTDVCR